MKTFFEKTKNMTPEERAEYLEKDDVSVFMYKTSKFKITVVHPSIAQLVERWTVVVYSYP